MAVRHILKHFSVYCLLGLVLVGCQAKRPETQKVLIGQTSLSVSVARTPTELYKGLSNQPSLPWDEGMLFVLPRRYVATFVMRDMRLGLDFIWIDQTTVVDITKNVPTPTTTELIHYQPSQAVTHVLEVNAGWTDRHGITIGDEVTFFID